MFVCFFKAQILLIFFFNASHPVPASSLNEQLSAFLDKCLHGLLVELGRFSMELVISNISSGSKTLELSQEPVLDLRFVLSQLVVKTLL